MWETIWTEQSHTWDFILVSKSLNKTILMSEGSWQQETIYKSAIIRWASPLILFLPFLTFTSVLHLKDSRKALNKQTTSTIPMDLVSSGGDHYAQNHP